MRKLSLPLCLVTLILVAGCTEARTPSTSPSNIESATDQTAPSKAPGGRKSKNPRALRGDWEKLGPEGFLELRLGMTRAEALKTGRITLGSTTGGCTDFYLAMYGDSARLDAHGYISADRGVSVIHGQDKMHTPEGIGLGSPWEALQNYAHLIGTEHFATATASDRGQYFFIGKRGQVDYFGLAIPGDPCLSRWVRQVHNR